MSHTVEADRGLNGDPDETIKEHVIDRHGLVWRVVRDGGMATRADGIGIISVGIAFLERFHGPLFNLSEFQSERAKEIDRNARAYGWEAHRTGTLPAKGTVSDDNPFLNPNWRDGMTIEIASEDAKDSGTMPE